MARGLLVWAFGLVGLVRAAGGLPAPCNSQWCVQIDAVAQPMCCPGCQAVAQAIVDFRIDDYYRERTALRVTAGAVDGTVRHAVDD